MKRMMDTFDILPAADEQARQNGWTIDYSFLRAVEARTEELGEHVCMEGVETVLLAVFDVLEVYFPNGLRGA